MGRRKRVKVRKAGGALEDFNLHKFRSSLRRVGADESTIDDVLGQILDVIGPHTTTKEIYRLAQGMLKKRNRPSGMRYSLKEALFRLGPTGYPFERYVADIFREYGYDTKVGLTLQGKCVTHEVDVLAVSDSEVSVMECKYHNARGTTTDVKVALYVRSRVADLEATLGREHEGKVFKGRLVTNTRCTSDAIAYAGCAGLEILSWRYPDGGGLEEMIEGKKLYPVTMIQGLQAGLVAKLIDEGILLLRELISLDSTMLQSRLNLSPAKVRTLKQRAEALCI